VERGDDNVRGQTNNAGKRARAKQTEIRVVQKLEGSPDVQYASKPRYEASRKPLPALPMWSPLLVRRTSCVPAPLRVGRQ